MLLLSHPPKLTACYIFLDIKHFGEKFTKVRRWKWKYLCWVWPIFFINQRGNGVNCSCCGKPICAKNSQSVITPQLLWISAKKPVWSLKAVFTFIWLDSFKAVRSYLAGLVEVDRLSANTMKIIICTFWGQTWIYIVITIRGVLCNDHHSIFSNCVSKSHSYLPLENRQQTFFVITFLTKSCKNWEQLLKEVYLTGFWTKQKSWCVVHFLLWWQLITDESSFAILALRVSDGVLLSLVH